MKFPSVSALKSWFSGTQASERWVAMTRLAPVVGSTLSRSRVFWSRDRRWTKRVRPSLAQLTRAR
ncbi:hypothetical protein D3C71_1759010 [compost metagenome]